MKHLMMSVLLVGAILALMAVSQDDSALQGLRQTVADLELRVARLEHAGGVHAARGGDEKVGAAHAMVLGGVQTTTGKAADPDAMAELEDEVDKLQNTVNDHMDRAEGEHAENGYWDGSNYYGRGQAGRSRRVKSQRAIANRYSTQLGIKQRELEAMQHSADKLTQVLHGHDGDTIITLYTTSDMSEELAGIEIGDVITWHGRRISAGDGSEKWEVGSIEKIEDGHPN